MNKTKHQLTVFFVIKKILNISNLIHNSLEFKSCAEHQRLDINVTDSTLKVFLNYVLLIKWILHFDKKNNVCFKHFIIFLL